MSGSPVLRSGVGTQMLTASMSAREAKSLLILSLPVAFRRAIVSLDTSRI